MSQSQQKLWATLENGIVRFPAFVHLPASARPESTLLLTNNRVESVKCINLSAHLGPWHIVPDGVIHRFVQPDAPYKRQIAKRWGIQEESIRALSVNLDGQKVLIETQQDWEDWTDAFFFRPTPSSSNHSSSNSDSRAKKEFTFDAVHIDVIVDLPDEQQTASVSAAAAAASTQDAPSAQATTSSGPELDFSTTEPITYSDAMLLTSTAVGTVARALQPHLQDFPSLRGLPEAIINTLTAHRRPASGSTSSDATVMPSSNAATSSAESASPRPEIQVLRPTTVQDLETIAQRQSLIQGMVDQLARVRSQPSQPPAPRQSSQAEATQTPSEDEMENELSRGFAQMLAQQPSAASAASAAPAAAAAMSASPQSAAMADSYVDATYLWEQDDEPVTIISTPSTPSGSSRASSSPRSRGAFESRHRGSPSRGSFSSRSRSGFRGPRRGRASRYMGTTMFILAMITCILAFISPTLASPQPATTSLLLPRSSPLVSPRQNSRHLHLCKCTCFQTNSTLVPLYSPSDPSKPCLTCTRQFCLDQGLEMCKGAKLEHADHDVGTGLEGDVWAKCFERDSVADIGS
ncbi:hypothetical protein PHSY_001316 [Pseudozyma hubeiensis SY62]|uniref:Uncharacterized protein n=1 Tax=Pseudozyma hubeiensis (strain SY62) TaxID=1305764 RepID=R9NYJ2_PSEHS|nr:hypothetical protein PHSY_001316 [Pseudozyma hubeiensis SY62]GAC93751.1 hypothetical protein PHSY_001316 [Pseudozyma hubeiensis SY62]